MNLFFCDASALGKCYVPETGTPEMQHLLAAVPRTRLFILMQALGETLSILVRRRNGGTLSAAAYQNATQGFRNELVAGNRVRFRLAHGTLIFASLPLIEQYSVNSTDALVLASALEMADRARPLGHAIVLVASDVRLLNSARTEGLAVFNPETDTIAQLDALIAAP